MNWASPDVQGSFPAAPFVKAGGYPETGTDHDITVSVQVTDNVGATSEATYIVHITSGNVPPVSNPGGPYFGAVNSPITLDGRQSYDPNAGTGDSIVSYNWDLDGNGLYNDGTGSTLVHTWTTPYTGQVGLKVCDSFGACSVGSAYTSITVSDLKPVSYPLISYKRLSTSVWEYEYKFIIKNQGNGDATNVSAVMANHPAQVTVLDGNVSFPSVPAGQQVTSTDTFKIRIDRSVPVQNSDLTWTLTFTDSSGTNWTLVNFPLY